MTRRTKQIRKMTRGDVVTTTETETIQTVEDDRDNSAPDVAARKPLPWYAWAIVAGMLGVWLAIATA